MQTETDHQPRLERRREPRQHRIKRARIAFDDVVLTGVVLDLSCSGARIYVRGAKVIPPWVQLHLPDATVAVARLRWRQQDECGFALVGTGAEVEAEREPVSCENLVRNRPAGKSTSGSGKPERCEAPLSTRHH